MSGRIFFERFTCEEKNRLKNYDYSADGAYFITICVKDRRELLGKIDVGEHNVLLKLTKVGKIVDTAIKNINKIYNSVTTPKYVVMPNHIHMIIILDNGSTMCSPTIPRIIKHYKEYITKQIGYSIWQKSYHDHIIRDEEDFQNHWQYIDENIAKWTEDEYFSAK